MFDILEKESICYQYFVDKQIKNREELRLSLKTDSIPGLNQGFIETIFANYKKEVLNAPKVKEIHPGNTKIICINDLHIPFHDINATSLCFEFIKEQQPNYLVLNGDIIDCYWESTFVKNPNHHTYLQEECDAFYKLFHSLKKYIPNTKIVYINGNHEDRIKRETWKNTAFFGVKSLEIPNLLKFDKLNIEFQPTRKIINNFIFTHGNAARKDSSYSAKAELINHNCHSGISGHTHRLGGFNQTSMDEVSSWYENGCLCTLNPEYTKEEPNWQQGFGLLDQINGMTFFHPINYTQGCFTYNGVLYK